MLRLVAIGTASGGLVSRCRGGDQAAWEELVGQFSNYVYAIAVRAFRLPAADAEDVFQETFARAYEKIDQLRDDSAIRPWLGQVARRLALDRIRDASREVPTEDVEFEAGSPELLSEIEEAMDVREAMLALSDECREMLDRFFARDQSYRMIGEELEIPLGTVASRISRCLEKLRGHYEGSKQPL